MTPVATNFKFLSKFVIPDCMKNKSNVIIENPSLRISVEHLNEKNSFQVTMTHTW